MKLIELEPKWLMHEGRRVGLIFVSPVGNKQIFQTCMFEKMSTKEQWGLWEENGYLEDDLIQGCNPNHLWSITSGDTFENLSISPSIDGSAGGTWHGHITNGQIEGGL